jgi:DNA-binding MarR family transcriptional regulator
VGNVSDEDIELERLVTQLLRAIAPDFSSAGSQLAGQEATNEETGKRSDDHDTGWPAADGADGRGSDELGGDGADRHAEVHPATDGTGLPELTASEARALIQLISARGIAQGELAGLLGLEKSTVSRLAAGLERKGWVHRGRDEGNQRYLRLYLTPAGADLAARVWQAWQSRQARILAALSADERAGLSAGLRGLVRGLAAEGLLEEVSAEDR